MLVVVTLTGCEPKDGTPGVKTAAVSLLRDVAPPEVLYAWTRWRERR